MTLHPMPLPPPDTFADLLLTVTAVSGELPTAQVSRLPGAQTYKQKAITQIKKKNLLSAYNRQDLRGLRLTSAGKRAMIEQYPERYQTMLSGENTLNAPKYSYSGRLRLHRLAEVLVTMFKAGVDVFPWEKPALTLTDGRLTGFSLDRPCYYPSLEVKEMGPQGMKVRGSRATGVLFAESGVYAVYNTGDTVSRWEYKAEMRLKALMQTAFSGYSYDGRLGSRPLQAILFSNDMKLLNEQMADARAHDRRERSAESQRVKTNYFILSGSYEHFHYLTNDRCGELVLQLLCDKSAKTMLDAILMQDLSHAGQGGVECDAYDKNGVPVLFGYTCDLTRIKRFDDALSLRDIPGTIICFDYQESALRGFCGSRVQFQRIDIDAVEGEVIHRQKEAD
ncbi:MAG: hypothetical protein IJQ98_02035 [Oscillospiraceae bacterium]|nr:hypothetical protein [Oscillospiraceae bacterium]